MPSEKAGQLAKEGFAFNFLPCTGTPMLSALHASVCWRWESKGGNLDRIVHSKLTITSFGGRPPPWKEIPGVRVGGEANAQP